MKVIIIIKYWVQVGTDIPDGLGVRKAGKRIRVYKGAKEVSLREAGRLTCSPQGPYVGVGGSYGYSTK